MGRELKVRELTEEERGELERRRGSRTIAKREQQRAEMILRKAEGESLQGIARRLQVDYETVGRWVHRFNETGLAGLVEREGRGRKRRYHEEERGQMIQIARTAPQTLGVGFNSWSLDRLREYVETSVGIAISRAQLARVLEAEGLKWYQERSYFTERPDPQFAEKRGRL